MGEGRQWRLRRPRRCRRCLRGRRRCRLPRDRRRRCRPCRGRCHRRRCDDVTRGDDRAFRAQKTSYVVDILRVKWE